MFSKRNKKIFTGTVMVIVAIGLIGPGALLLFAPRNQGFEGLDPLPTATLIETPTSSPRIPLPDRPVSP